MSIRQFYFASSARNFPRTGVFLFCFFVAVSVLEHIHGQKAHEIDIFGRPICCGMLRVQVKQIPQELTEQPGQAFQCSLDSGSNVDPGLLSARILGKELVLQVSTSGGAERSLAVRRVPRVSADSLLSQCARHSSERTWTIVVHKGSKEGPNCL